MSDDEHREAVREMVKALYDKAPSISGKKTRRTTANAVADTDTVAAVALALFTPKKR